MKKNMKIILLIILFSINIMIASAEKIYSTYRFDPGDYGPNFILEYNTETKKYDLGTIPLSDEKSNITYNDNEFIIGDYSYGTPTAGQTDYNLYLNILSKEIKKGESLSLYICSTGYRGGGNYSTGTRDIYIFYDEMHAADVYEKDNLISDIEEFLGSRKDSCKYLESLEVKEGTAESVKGCVSVESLIENLDNEMQNTDDLLVSTKIFKSYETRIIDLCSLIMGNQNFNSPCMTYCLNIKTTISEKRSEYGLEKSKPDIHGCNFSERLISFIGNILKWVKYILPVIVMVLGILDFIKALSSEKDDQMKKAQGRFMKRLISAALIFLIPLIIEFVLDKMGFDYNECGLF